MNQASQGILKNLNATAAADARTGEELLPLVYNELRRLAAAKLAREAPGQTWRHCVPKVTNDGVLTTLVALGSLTNSP